jgi:hypothetical protein
MTICEWSEAKMNFEVDDLDWAMGELLQLFARANRVGVPPHELDAALFHSAWSVLNAQPIEVRLRCRDTLMFLITRPLLFQSGVKSVKRYANALTH